MLVKQFILPVLSFFLLFTACTSDTNNSKNEIPLADLLSGRWELSQAIRNGKLAPTMEGTYFVFNGNNSMTTNMMGSDETSSFELNDRLISQNSNGIKTDYSIEKISTDSLQLKTTIRGFNFDLSMLKSTKETIDPQNSPNPET